MREIKIEKVVISVGGTEENWKKNIKLLELLLEENLQK